MLLGELNALVVEALHDKEASPTSDERLCVFDLILNLLPDVVGVMVAKVML